jgi:4-hydroxythreonine-4-phosphate dehydrogenase
MSLPRIVITAGEPAGIGPDILLKAAAQPHSAQLVAVGCAEVLAARAEQLNLEIRLTPYSSTSDLTPHDAGVLPLINIPTKQTVRAGMPDKCNASHVLAMIDQAVALCTVGECHAMVTGPVQKSIINDAGIPFSGHTEYLRKATSSGEVVMLLTSDTLRVALATTHIPLNRVSNAITPELLTDKLKLIDQNLKKSFGIARPRITVLGLNPHAGESGHLGKEEVNIIQPTCEALRQQGLSIAGPVPADSAFVPSMRTETDVYLAMYHDQGLPVLKSEGFENAVNVTLGLPFIRTSVDHGTALTLAGTGTASEQSLQAGIQSAIQLAQIAAS